MTPTQRKLLTELIVAELKKATVAALAAGASPADVATALDRRWQAVRDRGLKDWCGRTGNGIPARPRRSA